MKLFMNKPEPKTMGKEEAILTLAQIEEAEKRLARAKMAIQEKEAAAARKKEQEDECCIGSSCCSSSRW